VFKILSHPNGPYRPQVKWKLIQNPFQPIVEFGYIKQKREKIFFVLNDCLNLFLDEKKEEIFPQDKIQAPKF